MVAGQGHRGAVMTGSVQGRVHRAHLHTVKQQTTRPRARRATRRCLYSSCCQSRGMPRVSSKNQVTLPVEVMRSAGLAPRDEVTVRKVAGGEVLVAVRGSRVRRHAGIATGIYRPGELDQLRDDWNR